MTTFDADKAKTKMRQIGHRCGILFALFVVYLTIGGITFEFLEYEAREDIVEDTTDNLEQERQQLLSVLWAETMVKNEDDWLEVAHERLDLYEKGLKKALGEGIDLQDDVPSDNGDPDNQWDFVGSVFYCFTVVTTIGYGNLAPATVAGKVATIIYGSLGIPLTLILMGEVGKLTTLFLKWSISKRCPDIDPSEEFTFSVIASLGITIPFLLGGSAILWLLEDDWSFFDANYFSFITYSTIGFGDLVPTNLGYTLLLMIYILAALSLCAMCFTVIQNSLDDLLADKEEALANWWNDRRQKQAAAVAKKEKASESQKTKSSKDSRTSLPGKGDSSKVRRRGQKEEEEEEEEVDDDVEIIDHE